MIKNEPLLKDKLPGTVTGCDSSNDFILSQVKRVKCKKDSSCRTIQKINHIELNIWDGVL